MEKELQKQALGAERKEKEFRGQALKAELKAARLRKQARLLQKRRRAL
jgi:tRNA A-37 threonylcarbamoyl transferase component Bud32